MIWSFGDLHINPDKYRIDTFVSFTKIFLSLRKKGDVVIIGGDVFDRSIMPTFVKEIFIDFLLQINDAPVYVMTGNHDISLHHKNILSIFARFNNVIIIEDKKEIVTDFGKILMLPYKRNMEDYSGLEGTYDYVLCHFTHPSDQFFNEGIPLRVKGKQLYFHTHIQNERCIGVPYITRFGEIQDFRIIKISDKLEYVNIPKIFDFVDVIYGDKVSTDALVYKLIIHDAPSRKLARKMYQDYDIYNIHVVSEKYKVESEEDENFIKKTSLYDYFLKFSKDHPLDKDVYNILEGILK